MIHPSDASKTTSQTLAVSDDNMIDVNDASTLKKSNSMSTIVSSSLVEENTVTYDQLDDCDKSSELNAVLRTSLNKISQAKTAKASPNLLRNLLIVSVIRRAQNIFSSNSQQEHHHNNHHQHQHNQQQQQQMHTESQEDKQDEVESVIAMETADIRQEQCFTPHPPLPAATNRDASNDVTCSVKQLIRSRVEHRIRTHSSQAHTNTHSPHTHKTRKIRRNSTSTRPLKSRTFSPSPSSPSCSSASLSPTLSSSSLQSLLPSSSCSASFSSFPTFSTTPTLPATSVCTLISSPSLPAISLSLTASFSAPLSASSSAPPSLILIPCSPALTPPIVTIPTAFLYPAGVVVSTPAPPPLASSSSHDVIADSAYQASASSSSFAALCTPSLTSQPIVSL